MAYEHETAQAPPAEPYLGRFSEIIDKYYKSADALIYTFQHLEASQEVRSLVGEPNTLLSQWQRHRLNARHERFLTAAHTGFTYVFQQQVSIDEKAATIATLYEYPISNFLYVDMQAKSHEDNQPLDAGRRQRHNNELHTLTTNNVRQELLEVTFPAFYGKANDAATLMANITTGLLNKRLCRLARDRLGIELAEGVPMSAANRLITTRNLGMAIGAAGLIGLVVGIKTSHSPLRPASYFARH